jgi:integrase
MQQNCQVRLVSSFCRTSIRAPMGRAQRQAKPLLREKTRLSFSRRWAIGLRTYEIGLCCRRPPPELIAINCSDVERVREGIILTIRRSKTDQDGVGRRIGVPFGRTVHCPVSALDIWLKAARVEDGPVFRPVDRHGRVSVGRLSGEAVSLILRDRMAAAGFDPTGYSGHSLRAGFATSATRAGVSTIKIRQQTGHASDAMLSRYVRDGELFLGNAAGVLL